MISRIIEVVEYKPVWVEMFHQEKLALQSALNTDNVVAIHHIGSTSVQGLSAKPIIDILMEVKSLDELDRESHSIATLGYEVKGEYGITGRRYFQKGGLQHSHHIHAFLIGSPSAQRHLAFRDYLIAFPEIARQYGELKKEGAAMCRHSGEQYGKFKNNFVQEHEQKALDWIKTQLHA